MNRLAMIVLLLLHQDTLKVGVDLVTVGVRVTDSHGGNVRGLTAKNFTIFDDGSPQKIAVFSAGQEQSIELGILLDRSFSMSYNGKLERAKEAAQALVRAAAQGSEFFYLPFDDRLPLVQASTPDRSRMESAIEQTSVGRGTSLYDAVLEGIRLCKQTSISRQVLVIISDGADEHSKHNRSEVVEAVRNSQIQVFTIGYFGKEEERLFRVSGQQVKFPDGRFIENPRKILESIAQESGAEAFFPKSDAELASAAGRIADALQTEYMLAFYPTSADASGHYHQLRVRVSGGSYSVRARPGYSALP